jgi:hypothetical protein
LPHRAPASHINTPPAAALGLLLEAYDYARQLEKDVWDFAVEIGPLREAGLTNNHLRWLLCLGYAEHGIEQTRLGTVRRQFSRVDNLSLTDGACFVLTEAGAAYARSAAVTSVAQPEAERGDEKPVWDAARRELRFRGVLVKRFRQPSPSQEAILAAFDEESWPPRIDDPLPPETGQDAKRRLQRTIGNLNRAQENPVLHFQGGGDGQSVQWRACGVRAKAERGQGECS